MPTYEFTCPEHGTFERDYTFGEYDQLKRDEGKNALAPCVATGCAEDSIRKLQLFGNISTSDDPSFGSRPGEHRNRELAGFDPDSKFAAKNNGFTGWSERPKSKGWEYAD